MTNERAVKQGPDAATIEARKAKTKVLGALKKFSGPFTAQDIATATKIPLPTVRASIAVAKADGLVKSEGRGPHTKYSFAAKDAATK